MRLLFMLAAVALTPAAQSAPLVPLATATDLNLNFEYVARGVPGPCGAAWFALENFRWVCFDRGAEDIWEVTQTGRSANLFAGYQVLRGLLPGGNHLLIQQGQVYGLALGGPQAFVAGSFPALTFPVGVPQLVDAQGDGIPELILGSSNGSPGQLLSLPDFLPFTIAGDLAWSPPFAMTGQFDADPAGEVARFGASAIEFLDAGANSAEAYQVSGNYAQPSLAFQGDGDSALEIAARIDTTQSAALIDLGGTPIPISVADSGALLGFVPVNWSGDARVELAVLWQNRIVVVDPRSGASLASFANNSLFNGPLRSSHRLDWDGDGDEDVISRGNSMLTLLENPQGPRVLQYGAGEKQPIAATTHQGSPAVASAEAMVNGVHLVLRNAQTLAVIQRRRTDDDAFIDFLRGGDFSANAGIEAVYPTPSGLRARGVADGSILWTRAPTGAGRLWAHPVVAAAPCAAAACRRVLATDNSEVGVGQTSFVRMLDGDTGNTLWSLSILPLSSQRAAALGDINGDGIPDAIVGHAVGLQSESLIAIDGASGNVLWQRLLPAAAVAIAISNGDRQRLAILDRESTVNILLTTTGDIVASRRIYPFSCDIGTCSLAYVGRPGFPGEWAVRAPTTSQTFVREDLRHITATMSDEAFRETAQVGPGRALVGTSDSLKLVETPAEELFVDQFEDW